MSTYLNVGFAALGLALLAPLPAQADTPTVLEGMIKEKSGGPLGKARVQLKTAEKMITLRGHTPSLHKELSRLNKMNVRINALPKKGHHEVLSYELLSRSSGEIPQTGHFAGMELNGQYRILFVSSNGQASLLPIGWAKKMKRHVGAKAWVIGEPRDGQLTPKRFGILRSLAKD